MFGKAIEQVIVETMVDMICTESREVGEGCIGFDRLLTR